MSTVHRWPVDRTSNLQWSNFVWTKYRNLVGTVIYDYCTEPNRLDFFDTYSAPRWCTGQHFVNSVPMESQYHFRKTKIYIFKLTKSHFSQFHCKIAKPTQLFGKYFQDLPHTKDHHVQTDINGSLCLPSIRIGEEWVFAGYSFKRLEILCGGSSQIVWLMVAWPSIDRIVTICWPVRQLGTM